MQKEVNRRKTVVAPPPKPTATYIYVCGGELLLHVQTEINEIQTHWQSLSVFTEASANMDPGYGEDTPGSSTNDNEGVCRASALVSVS